MPDYFFIFYLRFSKVLLLPFPITQKRQLILNPPWRRHTQQLGYHFNREIWLRRSWSGIFWSV